MPAQFDSKFIFSDITQSDSGFLKEMCYEALFVPPGQDPLPLSILEKPALYKYFRAWGRSFDLGIKISHLGKNIGACWSRIHTPHNHGYGFVSEEIPELSIALKQEWRNQGLGGIMLQKLIATNQKAGLPGLSLSVSKKNQAIRLYKRFQFEIVAEENDAITMLLTL